MMRFQSGSLLACCVVAAALASSCVSTSTAVPSAFDARHQLVVKATFTPWAERSPVGWIYAFDDARGRQNRCVYVWSDSTWSLAVETSPGYFGDQIARGCVGTADTDGMLRLLDFPPDALDGWGRVYAAGGVEAAYKGHAIPRDTQLAGPRSPHEPDRVRR